MGKAAACCAFGAVAAFRTASLKDAGSCSTQSAKPSGNCRAAAGTRVSRDIHCWTMPIHELPLCASSKGVETVFSVRAFGRVKNAALKLSSYGLYHKEG